MCTGNKRNPLESLQLAHWTRRRRDLVVHIKLHHLCALALPCVLDLGAHTQSSVG